MSKKIGLKATVALLTKGYTKKEIEELAAIDEEQEQNTEVEKDEEPEAAKEETPDYKSLYEELLKEKEAKDKEIEDKDKQIKEIQKDNVHENNLPELEQLRADEEASLADAFRGFY